MADNEVARMLYVRLPHTIKSSKEIEDLCVGNVKVKLTRQSSRHCHVIFPSVQEKMKNLKSIKKTKINGKSIIVFPPKINASRPIRKKEKKINIHRPKAEPKMSPMLHISNIKPGTKVREIKDAFPGCSSVMMIKSKGNESRAAYINMGSGTSAAEYLRKEREWPEVRGNVLAVAPDTRKKKGKSEKKSSDLKIYDGETAAKERKNASTSSQESGDPEDEEESDSDGSSGIEEE